MERNVLVDKLAFAEGPRWRNGRLYFSDVHAGAVLAVSMDGAVERIAEIDGGPSGLGWLPDGTLLVAVGEPAAVLAVSPGGDAKMHADLADVAVYSPNDMVVDAAGRAYLGTCDVAGISTGAPGLGQIICVEPDGAVRVVDSEMRFPNGSVITPDGRTLIVGETFGQGLTARDVAADGSLSNKRVWAEVPGSFPDGCCLDAEGAVWFADPVGRAAVRVGEGGEVLGRVETDMPGCYACTLGGHDMRTLFLLTGRLGHPAKTTEALIGRIEYVTVDVPGTGSP
jgi:sugar lactone lactonase YvrE